MEAFDNCRSAELQQYYIDASRIYEAIIFLACLHLTWWKFCICSFISGIFKAKIACSIIIKISAGWIKIFETVRCENSWHSTQPQADGVWHM